MNGDEVAFVERVHGLAQTAHDHDTARVNALTEVRAKLRELNTIIDEATPHVIAENQAVGSILYLSQERLGIAVPLTAEAKRLPRTLAVLLTAALLSGTVGAGYSFKDIPMAKSVAKNKGDASGYLVAAREAQIRKEWKRAAEAYDMAHECGAGAECSLGRMAECQFYAGMTEGVKETLGRLEKATKGESPTVAYIRGLIAFERMDLTAAKRQFQMAESLGDTRATIMLKRVHYAR